MDFFYVKGFTPVLYCISELFVFINTKTNSINFLCFTMHLRCNYMGWTDIHIHFFLHPEPGNIDLDVF